MVRATTPTFVLEFEDIDLTEALELFVTLRQGSTVLTKTGNDLEVTETTITVFLSQEETLSFCEGKADLQVNWVYSDNSRACSNIVSVAVGRNLLPEVIENG